MKTGLTQKKWIDSNHHSGPSIDSGKLRIDMNDGFERWIRTDTGDLIEVGWNWRQLEGWQNAMIDFDLAKTFQKSSRGELTRAQIEALQVHFKSLEPIITEGKAE